MIICVSRLHAIKMSKLGTFVKFKNLWLEEMVVYMQIRYSFSTNRANWLLVHRGCDAVGSVLP
jgi:hypothetical protein